ncbi:MAG: sulfotransferase domain-containing protein [Chthoniobacterales bacterium]|nr:sulfotransferase domain-containing protein [Chthoniobacterales bacterium]
MFFSQRRFQKLHKNVVVFTTHKAGSMVLHRVLKDICDHNNIRYHSENQPDPDKLPVAKMFRGKDYIAKHNGCFGPMRFYVPSRALAEANILLHLRDPRDVLTSMFFSYCFMHRGAVPPNTGVRREVAEAGIDKFVLDMSGAEYVRYQGDYGTGGNFKEHIGNVLERYEQYQREIVGRPNTVLVRYEMMVADFSTWLAQVVSRFESVNHNETYEFAAAARAHETRRPAAENISLHKRKVTPGDYKEKLKPQTIAELNRRFSNLLTAFGFPV